MWTQCAGHRCCWRWRWRGQERGSRDATPPTRDSISTPRRRPAQASPPPSPTRRPLPRPTHRSRCRTYRQIPAKATPGAPPSRTSCADAYAKTASHRNRCRRPSRYPTPTTRIRSSNGGSPGHLTAASQDVPKAERADKLNCPTPPTATSTTGAYGGRGDVQKRRPRAALHHHRHHPHNHHTHKPQTPHNTRTFFLHTPLMARGRGWGFADSEFSWRRATLRLETQSPKDYRTSLKPTAGRFRINAVLETTFNYGGVPFVGAPGRPLFTTTASNPKPCVFLIALVSRPP